MLTKSIRLVNSHYSIGGELSVRQIEWAAAHGFCSILNLQLPSELRLHFYEARLIESLKMVYAHSPISVTETKGIDVALETLIHLPKPALVHCRGGYRAIALVLMAIAVEQSLTAEQFIKRVEAHGFTVDHPPIKQFYRHWLDTYQVAMLL